MLFPHLKYFLLLYVYIHGMSQVSALKGDSWCGTLMCVAAVVNGSTTTYKMTALNQLGWMSVGFGSVMSDTPMVILWKNLDGSTTLSQRQSHGLIEPRPVVSPLRRAKVSQRMASADPSHSQSLFFEIPTNKDIVQELVWAYGLTQPVSSNPSITLEQHLDAGTFTLDLSKETNQDDRINSGGRGPGGSDPDPGPSPSPSKPLPAPINSTSPNSTLPTSSPDKPSSFVSLSTYKKLLIVHGALASIGFLLLLPMGILLARYGRVFTRHWFKAHWFFNIVLSLPVITIGWAFGFLAIARQGTSHLSDMHQIFGLILFILYFIQIFLGAMVHFFRDSVVVRPSQNLVHPILGLSIVVLAVYQTRTGLVHEWAFATGGSSPSDSFSVMWIAWVVILPIAYVLGFFFLPRQFEQEHLGVDAPVSSTQFSDSHCPTYSEAIGLAPRRSVFTPTDDMYSDLLSSDAGRSRPDVSSAEGMAEMREVPSVVPVTVVSARRS